MFHREWYFLFVRRGCDDLLCATYQCSVGISTIHSEVVAATAHLAVVEHEIIGAGREHNVLVGRSSGEDAAGYCAGDVAFIGVCGCIVGQHRVRVVS